MKLAFCTSLTTSKKHKGGGGQVIIKLAEFLTKHGYSITIFSRDQPSDVIFHFLRKNNIKLCSLKDWPEILKFFFEPIRAFRLMKPFFHDFDFVQPIIGGFGISALMLRMFHKDTKIIANIHEIMQAETEPNLRIKVYNISDKVYMRTVAEKACCTLVHSNFMKQSVQTQFRKVRNCVVIPNGIDTELFIPKKTNSEITNFWNQSSNFKLLFVGRLNYRKGILNLIWAIKQLSRKNLNCSLLVIGDGELSLKAKKLVKRLGLEKRIAFIGQIRHENLPNFYSAADLTVVPSIFEPFGLVSLESLSCGTPVLATANSGFIEILKGSKAEFIPSFHPYDITNSITSFFLRNWEKNCNDYRDFVVKYYDWEKILPRYLRLYNFLNENI
jgi:glycosyltransferase involved in cell wall biosynthesis